MMELPLDRAYHWERTRPHEAFLTQPINGVARDWTWAQTMDEARRMASFLIAQNWPAGSHIVIYSKNCSWWIMAELAIWMAGHASVPIYPSLTSLAAAQLFEHCEPVSCFVGPLDATEAAHSPFPPNTLIIRFPNAALFNDAKSWDEIIESTEPIQTNPQRGSDEIATIIYTSGTTGAPKGAMHRFQALPYFALAISQVGGEGRQRHLSYLPLAHIAERSLTEIAGIFYCWHLFFNESTATFLEDLQRAEVTIFFSVPRLYAKFQQKVFAKVPRATLDLLLRVPLLKVLASKYILKNMGFAKVAFAASGSAALPAELLRWYLALGLPITEGYGTTETGITHTSPKGESRPGYTGKNALGVEAKISDSGELLLRSPMNMVGYYKNPEATQEVLSEDGFLRTGDLAELTADGWLKIVGRNKEQFKTAKGKYVAPAKIEALLGAHPAAENCLVLGANLVAPCGIVVLTAEAALQASTEAGRRELQKSFTDLLDAINAQVEAHEHLACVVIVNDRWTIESGFVTPTLKLRRFQLETHYGPLLAAWLAQERRVVFATP